MQVADNSDNSNSPLARTKFPFPFTEVYPNNSCQLELFFVSLQSSSYRGFTVSNCIFSYLVHQGVQLAAILGKGLFSSCFVLNMPRSRQSASRVRAFSNSGVYFIQNILSKNAGSFFLNNLTIASQTVSIYVVPAHPRLYIASLSNFIISKSYHYIQQEKTSEEDGQPKYCEIFHYISFQYVRDKLLEK